jgi:hypothetical protein
MVLQPKQSKTSKHWNSFLSYCRRKGRGTQFLVHQKGYGNEDDTWLSWSALEMQKNFYQNIQNNLKSIKGNKF